MNILIFGHTGMLGNALKQHWKNKHHLVGISRKRLQQSNIESHTWDDLDDILTKQKFDVAINLCGETIGQPWHKFSRKKIESSRIETTKKIVNAISTLPIHLINASGIGIYDSVSHLNETRFDEKTPVLKSNGFLQTLAYEWEKEAIKHQTTTLLRTAVVFKKDDGVLKKLLMGKQIKVLTQLGSGNNPFPWISIEDWSRAIDLVVSKKILGPINLPNLLLNTLCNTCIFSTLYKSFSTRK